MRADPNNTHASVSNRSSVCVTSADGLITCRLVFSLLACYASKARVTCTSVSENRRSLIKLAQALHSSCSQFSRNAHVAAEWERWNVNVLLNPKHSHQSLQHRSDWTFVLEQGTFTGTFPMERLRGRNSGKTGRREQPERETRDDRRNNKTRRKSPNRAKMGGRKGTAKPHTHIQTGDNS